MKISLFWGSLLVSMSFMACDNDVVLLSLDEPAIPVVYGLINSSEDEQIINISRLFRFSGDGSAGQSAQNPDSLYYTAEALSVSVKNERNDLLATLNRVNLSEEQIPRDPGSFVTDPNIVYRFRLSDLQATPGDSLTFSLQLPDGGLAKATVALLKTLEPSNTAEPPRVYALTSSRDILVGWRRSTVGAPIQIFEIGYNFAYTETGPNGMEDKILYFPAAQELAARDNFANVSLEGFLPFIGDRLKADPDITRRFRYIQQVITGGDNSYSAYRDLILANSGITATQELPPFSNIENGLGLLASITQLKQPAGAGLTNTSSDSLRFGTSTRDLNFQ